MCMLCVICVCVCVFVCLCMYARVCNVYVHRVYYTVYIYVRTQQKGCAHERDAVRM